MDRQSLGLALDLVEKHLKKQSRPTPAILVGLKEDLIDQVGKEGDPDAMQLLVRDEEIEEALERGRF